MTVRVGSLQWAGIGGVGAVTSFSDSFNRASGKGENQNWFSSTWWSGGLGPNRKTEFIIGATAGSQGLISNNAGINNPTIDSRQFFMCAPLFTSLNGLSQSAKVVLVEEGNPTAFVESGLVVCCNASGNVTADVSAYVLMLANAQSFVQRFTAGVETGMIVPAARPAMPVTYELRAVISALDVTLTLLINDVVDTVVVDATASRVSLGSVGFFGHETMSGGLATRHGFRDFVGRRL